MKKILIVDDSRTVLELLKSELTDYEVLTAKDGSQALGLVQKNEFDAIVTDQNMPNMTGVELISTIRRALLHRFKPIIILTDDPDIKQEAKNAGASAYLAKPFKTGQLKAILNMTIGS